MSSNRVILPFAPPAPLRIAPLCSQASSLLRPSLTSHARASAATAPRLPAAGYDGFPSPARHETSRFPSKERLHMPGSPTTPGRPGARTHAPVRVAFRDLKRVGARNKTSFAAQWLAYALPCRRFACTLTNAGARLGADVGRYSFIVSDSHRLPSATSISQRHSSCRVAVSYERL